MFFFVVVSDVCEPAVRRQSDPYLHGSVCDGRLGVLLCRGFCEEPQALSHLQGQRLPPGQSQAEITDSLSL